MSQPSPKAIYGAYRTTLRALRKARNGAPQRSGARKQIALKTVADRYGTPMGDVKRIVRIFDAVAGITHDHPVGYEWKVAFTEAWEASVAKFKGEPCSICGTEEESAIVRPRILGVLEGWEYEMRNRLPVERIAKGHYPAMGSLMPDEWAFVPACFSCKMKTVGITLASSC
jgi:hypothetical protein